MEPFCACDARHAVTVERCAEPLMAVDPGAPGLRVAWVTPSADDRNRADKGSVARKCARPPPHDRCFAIPMLRPLSALVYDSFDVCGATDGPRARALLAIYDRLTGEALSEAVDDPMRDERGTLRRMDGDLRRVLMRAAETGRLRVERVVRPPSPFPDSRFEAPAPPLPPPVSTDDLEHFLELQIVNTTGMLATLYAALDAALAL